ncbi:MAG: Pr6Pr family membrane protein [Propionibacteriaceae bacterium]|nr:Pr6Pr family membrane protein [Propionibacteriaceae bacterium]
MIAALAAQFQASVSLAIGLGRDVGLTVVNFFSFFTVLSNLGAALVLASIAWTSVQRPGTLTRTAGLALACVTTAMLVTGVVYNLLLRSIELPQGTTVPWSSEVLHVVGPVFMPVDLLVAPGLRRLSWSALGWVLAFPLVWVAYTVVRGPCRSTLSPAVRPSTRTRS